MSTGNWPRIGVAALGAAAVALATPLPAWGAGDVTDTATETFEVRLTPLNGSGVHGTGTLILDESGHEPVLTVRLDVNNVIPGQLHPQHIHGFTADGPVEGKGPQDDATCPTGGSRNQIEGLPEEAQRPDRSLALEEGLDEYGPVLLPLQPFPVPEDRDYLFVETYTGDELDALNLDEVALTNRHIVIHGGLVDGFDRDGRPDTYVASLPVACGEIEMSR
ncbi:hypothetical protein [Blastococcus saxobsidens]|uniref:CHRD domain-containing protein n=1 Tax=Blastococcus saxobsidens (strain DD2) TaxID=1146883 RepID=H6RIQ7_BLASD|nr:hypothetical protein [Blastococcus saxobsidens]CCG02251.1 conserved exported protein of unknown function [Blastococcus saxobsidens DD2]